jgi:hypothetical protein
MARHDKYDAHVNLNLQRKVIDEADDIALRFRLNRSDVFRLAILEGLRKFKRARLPGSVKPAEVE